MKTRMRSWRGWIGFLGLLLLSACGGTERESEAPPPDYPNQVTYDYHTTQSHGGVREWELWGESAERFPNKTSLTLQGVRMIFYRDGEKDAVLTSESGEIDEKTQDLVARGNVVVVSESGRKLECEVLYWDAERRIIHNDVFDRITDGDQVLTGYGMDTDPDLTNIVLHEQVEGEFSEDSSGGGRQQP